MSFLKPPGLVIIVFSLILSACQNGENNPTLTKEEHQPPGLIFAVPPYEMPSRIQQRFEPLTSYLSEVLDQPVQLYITHSYEDQIKRLALGEVDLAYMGPSSYVKTRDNFQQTGVNTIELIVAEAPYRAAIIVHQNSDIKSLTDLKNHSLAFGSYHSYTGHFIVRQLLRLEQIYLRDLQFYSYLGRHERAIMSVVHQEFDAAATTEGLAKRFIDLGYPIRVLHTSELLAPTVIVARKGLDTSTIESLRDALLLPSDKQLPKIAQSGHHFYEVDDYEFLEVRRILDLIEY
ncbi:phosphate/phosphite/phosphonate ABC transporter substrate-binding protein [Thiomicrospira microaerophila]|uniref:phosphate/phosphite/phosphonate ABC transporter substrate-binding protein n=1 Tax=Thiomicrospira microaerophila TaxID=406020 RepID=UPI00200C7AB4|nr:phosphate/phosphite/phosphonate ABC transporter substrate-binding protein [Thiomicrospira microaerophila]UQB43042.1 phosphate/phosphite/phosphonate ABC transporter substrate-binding protein [Thiomicrospira microaerophila]